MTVDQAVQKCLSQPPSSRNKIGEDSGGYTRYCTKVRYAGLDDVPCRFMRDDVVFMRDEKMHYLCTRRDEDIPNQTPRDENRYTRTI